MKRLFSLSVVLCVWFGYVLLVGVCAFVACTQISCAAGLVIGRDSTERTDAAISIKVKCGSSAWIGSGVLVGGNDALTAYHVVKCSNKARAMSAITSTGEVFRVKVLAYNVAKDVARVRLVRPAGDHPLVSPVSVAMPRQDDRVCMYPANPRRQRKCGEVHRVSGRRMLHSILSEPGNSGAGVYNRNGDLVGIVTQLQRCDNGLPICGGLATVVVQVEATGLKP